MFNRIAAIVFIYLCICGAWLILGTSVVFRTDSQDIKMRESVNQLWGTAQRQKAPSVYTLDTVMKTETIETNGKKETKTVPETVHHMVSLDSSDIKADMKLDYRRKGLLWYSTYLVDFDGQYKITNDSNTRRRLYMNFEFPTNNAVYDDFKFMIGGKEIKNIQQIDAGVVVGTADLDPGQSETFQVHYRTQGQDQWWYDFGDNVKQIKNFNLTMNTDFDKIDFPDNSVSPTSKQPNGKGWKLTWNYSSLLSGVKLGLIAPKKLNPGPWVSKVTYFAPVSLFLFFFLLLIFSALKDIRLHPMHYFFIGCSFFSFHLLLAYLVDHLSIHLAFVICSIVSIFLVMSYMRMVVKTRSALLQIGISQFVYLVLFSYTYFFEGFTGLAITILCIATLFIVMQCTGKVDWDKAFGKKAV